MEDELPLVLLKDVGQNSPLEQTGRSIIAAESEVEAEQEDRSSFGRLLRAKTPRSSHGNWTPASDRPDPIELIENQNADRLAWLVPLRRGRMSASPFSFYRGAATVMAADLATTPTSGLQVQLCGDAHLANFGVYASPERQLVFDLNDFDETLPGPFEWDVKRLAGSFVMAGRHRGFDADMQRRHAEAATRAYRTAMLRFAEQGWLDTWYSYLPLERFINLAKSRGVSKKQITRAEKFAAKAKSRDHLQAASKLVERSNGGYRFKSTPPVLVPYRELPEAAEPDRLREAVHASFNEYRESVNERTRSLVDRYRLVDAAIKVVGVGSVGTRCSVGLFLGRQPDDVLILQVKEATDSVLEQHLPSSRFTLHGRRVVEGQRLMQASSDIFLGWSTSAAGRHFYWRQLRDWKGSVDLDVVTPELLGGSYAELCGWTLARAHAVSGDPAAIAGYLGQGDVFDRAMGEFAMRYSKQNLADYEAFRAAIADGGLDVDTAD